MLVPPPPTPASHVSVPPPMSPRRTPTPAQSPTEQFNIAMKDFLQKVADAQNKSTIKHTFFQNFENIYFLLSVKNILPKGNTSDII